MNAENKIDQELTDKKSQGSCKLSKSRKIKKPIEKSERLQKTKEKNPKITNFFKKLPYDDIQRPRNSSQKKEQRKSPEEQQIIQELQNQQRQLQHEEQMLKKQIQTLKSEQQIMNQEWSWYLRKLRQCQVIDLKDRYQIIRMQKSLPEVRMITVESIVVAQNQTQKVNNCHALAPQIKEIEQQIKKKEAILQNSLQVSFIQRQNLLKDIKALKLQLQFAQLQMQKYQEKLYLCEKQKKCKFSKLNWPLINKRYQSLQLIASGGYSEVYKAYNLSNNQIVAIKLCSVAQMAQTTPQVYLKHLFRQCETHKSLSHPNIVKLYEVIQLDKTTFCLILQFCQGPQLSKYLKRKGVLCEEETKMIMFQIFQALYYLSICKGKKIVHYDLKPQNIMFHQGLVKILDFGLNKQIDQQQSRAALTSVGLGTHAYLPPEIHQLQSEEDRVLSNKVDIWSSGIIFYELLTSRRPTKIEDIQLLKEQKTQLSQQTVEIIKMCLKLDPSERITPQLVYFHSYFDEFERRYQREKK